MYADIVSEESGVIRPGISTRTQVFIIAGIRLMRPASISILTKASDPLLKCIEFRCFPSPACCSNFLRQRYSEISEQVLPWKFHDDWKL